MAKHAFNDDGHGDCTECPLPANHPRHQPDVIAVNEPDPVITQHQAATSQAAGEAARLRSGSLKEAAYKFLVRRPTGATTEEIETELGRSHQSVSSAVNSLSRAGHIRIRRDADDVPAMRKTRSGRYALVYEAASASQRGVA